MNDGWGPVGPLIKKRWGSWRYRLTQHSCRVEMQSPHCPCWYRALFKAPEAHILPM